MDSDLKGFLCFVGIVCSLIVVGMMLEAVVKIYGCN